MRTLRLAAVLGMALGMILNAAPVGAAPWKDDVGFSVSGGIYYVPAQSGMTEYRVWPKWEGTAEVPTQDLLGVPQLGNVDAIGVWLYPSGNLAKVAIQYSSSHTQLKPGDLFIDLVGGTPNKTQFTWDYVVRTPFFSQYKTGTTIWSEADISATSTWDIYSFATPIPIDSSSAYQLSQNSNPRDGTMSWSQVGNIRDNHPWALDATYLGNGTDTNQDATFSGWKYSGPTPRYSEWDFGPTGLDLGSWDNMYIGFTVNCTNDILYQSFGQNETGLIPEPGTLAIWGLLGLLSASACWWQGRRRGAARRWPEANRAAILEMIERGRLR